MNDYLEIFSDVIRLATMQPRYSGRLPSAPGIREPERERIDRTPRRLLSRGF